MIREGDSIVFPADITVPDAFTAEILFRRGQFETVGPTQAALMTRAKNSDGGGVMTEGEKERMAANRLEVRGLLRRQFPGAGPGHPLRRHLLLTRRGHECWLLVKTLRKDR